MRNFRFASRRFADCQFRFAVDVRWRTANRNRQSATPLGEERVAELIAKNGQSTNLSDSVGDKAEIRFAMHYAVIGRAEAARAGL